jgi:alkylation response protein AidB-like acyl-CoA dehydrogenase
MPLEAAANAPRTAVHEQTDHTNSWLDRVEASVDSARAVLLSSQRSGLLQFISEMESACRERSALAVHPAMAPRLAALRTRLTMLRSMLRQAAAFEQAREQLVSECVLGYTPTGLERAL